MLLEELPFLRAVHVICSEGMIIKQRMMMMMMVVTSESEGSGAMQCTGDMQEHAGK